MSHRAVFSLLIFSYLDILPLCKQMCLLPEIKNKEDNSKLQWILLGVLGKKMRWDSKQSYAIYCSLQLMKKRFMFPTSWKEYSPKMLIMSNTLVYLYQLTWVLNTHVNNLSTKANSTHSFLRWDLYACPWDVKEEHSKDWCTQSWNMVVLFRIPKLKSFKTVWKASKSDR